jgi:hypothetical protein
MSAILHFNCNIATSGVVSAQFGIRLEARWTPTDIESDSKGWWCDRYWGCRLPSGRRDEVKSYYFTLTTSAWV